MIKNNIKLMIVFLKLNGIYIKKMIYWHFSSDI